MALTELENQMLKQMKRQEEETKNLHKALQSFTEQRKKENGYMKGFEKQLKQQGDDIQNLHEALNDYAKNWSELTGRLTDLEQQLNEYEKS